MIQFQPTWTYHENLTKAVCVTDQGDLVIHRIYGIELQQYIDMAYRAYRNGSTGDLWPTFERKDENDWINPEEWIKTDFLGENELVDPKNHLLWINPLGLDVVRGLFAGMYCIFMMIFDSIG